MLSLQMPSSKIKQLFSSTGPQTLLTSLNAPRIRSHRIIHDYMCQHGLGVEKSSSLCMQFSAKENAQIRGLKAALNRKVCSTPAN